MLSSQTAAIKVSKKGEIGWKAVFEYYGIDSLLGSRRGLIERSNSSRFLFRFRRWEGDHPIQSWFRSMGGIPEYHISPVVFPASRLELAETSQVSYDVFFFCCRHWPTLVTWIGQNESRLTQLPTLCTISCRVEKAAVENLILPLSPVVVKQVKERSVLQLVLISPSFLDWIVAHPEALIGTMLCPRKVLAMHSGITPQKLTTQHKSGLDPSSVLILSILQQYSVIIHLA